MASWLDVRACGTSAQWLVRIEDADVGRCLPGMDKHILGQLAACGMHPDRPPVWQTQRSALYRQALDRLIAAGRAYPCACSRKDIQAELARRGVAHDRHGERVYPGTCRSGLNGRPARAWRFAVVPLDGAAVAEQTAAIDWTDRRLGPQQQNIAAEVGDFVLRRADGVWAYQLAVVVDDADQRISDVVRGEDLTDNTARQIALQRALGMPTPTYLHTPLVLAADGQKLSKQNGAQPIDTSTPPAALAALVAAAQVLGLPLTQASTAAEALARWIPAWRDLYNSRP